MPGRRLVTAQHPQLVPVELTKEIEQLCGFHALCFSLQVMQTRVHGIAFRRAAAIGSPQSRQMPKVPFLHAIERFLDRLQDLRVSLLQFELNVNFVVAARLIREIALAGIGLRRRRQRLVDAAGGRQNLATLPEKRILKRGLFHGSSPQAPLSPPPTKLNISRFRPDSGRCHGPSRPDERARGRPRRDTRTRRPAMAGTEAPIRRAGPRAASGAGPRRSRARRRRRPAAS